LKNWQKILCGYFFVPPGISTEQFYYTFGLLKLGRQNYPGRFKARV